MNMMNMNWNKYLSEDDLFVRAFAPLHRQLNAQAEAAGQHGFIPWVMRAGKGGSAQYIDYYDVSLYRHCMDVAVVAFMLFVHAWQNGTIPHPDDQRELLAPTDDATAEKILRLLFAVAFLHDADKYEGSGISSSPCLEQVTQLHSDLAVETWAGIDAKTSLALISVVEKMRGIGQSMRAGAKPTPAQEYIAELVGWGDAIVSEGSRAGISGVIEAYNTRLPSLSRYYNLPTTPLRLLTFRYHPAVLHQLQHVFLTQFYDHNIFPLVCLLDGHVFQVSVLDGFDLESVFVELTYGISANDPDMKRIHNTGEIILYNVRSPAELQKAVARSIQRNDSDKLLSVKAKDYTEIIPVLNQLAREMDLPLAEKGSGQFLLTMQKGTHDNQFYRYAVTLATALRGIDEKSTLSEKQFNERTERLLNEHPKLKDSLRSFNLASLQKDSRQTLIALFAAFNLEDDNQLQEVIDTIYGKFPASSEDEGAQAIIAHLKAQCGLGKIADQHPLYAPHPKHPKAGTCVLCNAPADREISQKLKTQVNTSAFYNGMGHSKSIWSQDAVNYLCPACIKQQELMLKAFPKLRTEPILVATPFRALIKGSFTEGEESALRSYQIYSTDTKKGKTWRDFLPWNVDHSGYYPFDLEEIPSGFEETLKAMQRWAKFSLISGNPVHVFVAAQREVKSSFVFEQMPPLLETLLNDLSVSTADIDALAAQLREQKGEKIAQQITSELYALQKHEDRSIRRSKLPLLVERLSRFQMMLTFNNGMDALQAMREYGWWAVAWLHQRNLNPNSPKQDRSSLDWLVQFAIKPEHYPMTEETSKLKQLADLAAQIQRYPGYDASNSDKRFCLSIAIEQLENRSNCGLQDETTLVAAIAGNLNDSLKRRGLETGKGSAFPKRCEAFAHAVYDFVQILPPNCLIDPRFQRFASAAYAHLFMQASLSKTKENKEKYTDNTDSDTPQHMFNL